MAYIKWGKRAAQIVVLAIHGIAGIFQASAAPDCQSPPTGLISWWRAEGDARDAADGNSGVLNNGVGFVPGKVGQAFSFNGTNSYIEVPDAPALRFTNVLTIECWVRRPRLTPGDFIIEKGGNWNSGSQNYAFALNALAPYDHALYFLFNGGFRVAPGLPDTNWHHCAVVATNGQANPAFYVDGVQQAVFYGEGSATINLYPSTRPVHIGAQVDPFSGWFFYGQLGIDELAIYNRGLSAAEIQAIYNASSSGKCVSTPPPPATNCTPASSGLVGWWRGQSNALDTISGNNGTLSGGVGFSPAEVGLGFVFNGTGEVVVASTPALNLQSMTLEAWVKPSVLDANVETILNKENDQVTSSSDASYELGIRGPGEPGNGSIPVGNLAFYLGGVSGVPSDYGGWINGGGQVPTNRWTHVALAFDGTSARVYINGALTRTLTGLGGAVNTTTGPFKIGSRSAGEVSANPAVRFNGSIDEVSIYSRALSTSEIQAVFNASTAGKCVPPSGCISPPSGLVSWWRAETNGVDQAGTNNGTLAGNTSFVAGRVGQAFVFDGSRDGVGVGNPTSLQLQTFTIEAWVKRASSSRVSLDVHQTGGIFVSSWGGYGLGLWDDGRPFLTKVGYDNISPTFAISDTNTFHHVAVTKSGTNVVFYLDGVAQAVGPYTSTFEFGGPAAIGATGGDYAASFLGSIDEVSVYNRALSANEILSIYSADGAGKCPGPTNSTNCAPPGIISWWPGEGAPNDVVDGNTGTIYGGVSFTNGVVGQAFRLNGSSGHIRIADRPNLRFTNGLTVEAWVNPIPGTARHQAVIGKWDNFTGPANQKTLSFSINTEGRLYLYVSGNGFDSVSALAISSNSLVAGQWSHVAGTYDGSSVRVYINGALRGQIAYNQGIFPGTNDMAIGGVVGGSPPGTVTTPFAG